MIALITRFLTIVLALLVVARFVPGVEVESLYTAIIVAIVLGLMNITIKPILFILTLPFTLITFGLFALVLNALLFWFAASFVEGFTVTGFIPAFLGALSITIAGWIVTKLT